MVVSRIEGKRSPDPLTQRLQHYQTVVRLGKDNYTTHKIMLNELINANITFRRILSEEEKAIAIIEQIYTNGLKRDSNNSHAELNMLMLGALFENNQPHHAVECYLSFHHQKIAMNHDIHNMMIEMLCDIPSLELLAKIYRTVNLNIVDPKLHQKTLRLCFSYNNSKEHNTDNSIIQLVCLVLTNVSSPELILEYFQFAIKNAIAIKNLELVEAILKSFAELKPAGDAFYSFALESAIAVKNSELVELIYQEASRNMAASDELYAKYFNSKTYLPPTYVEVLKRINQLENLLTINPDLTKQDLGEKNSIEILLDEGVYQEIGKRIINAAFDKHDKFFLAHQLTLAKLVCPADRKKWEDLTCSVIRSAVNCMELRYAWELYEAGSEIWSDFASNFELLQHLIDVFIFHHVEFLDQAYNQALYLLQQREEDFFQMQEDLNPLQIAQYYNLTKEAHHKIIRAMGKSENTLDKAFIIFKTLCEYQKGRLVDWSVCSYIIIQACRVDNLEMANKALNLTKKVLDEGDILFVRREMLREVVDQPTLLATVSAILLQEATEVKQLQKCPRPEEEYPLKAQYSTLSERIMVGLAGTKLEYDPLLEEKCSVHYSQEEYSSYSQEEEDDRSLYEEAERKKETEFNGIPRRPDPVRIHREQKSQNTNYTLWSPLNFKERPHQPAPSGAFTSSFDNSAPQTTYKLWNFQ